MQQVRARHKMRLSFHLGASKLALLFLALLCLVPRAAPSPLHPPSAPLDQDRLAERPPDPRPAPLRPGLEGEEEEGPWEEEEEEGPWEEEEEEEEEDEGGSWEEEALLRAQRGDPLGRPRSPFPVGLSLEGANYQEGGDGEDGGKRNEALTSIAGGLQAVSREKGGFGFRFGRKRWSDMGWMD